MMTYNSESGLEQKKIYKGEKRGEVELLETEIKKKKKNKLSQ